MLSFSYCRFVGEPNGGATGDAVIVVPGIMGSELVDVTTGDTLGGLGGPGGYLGAWAGGSALKALALTDNERAGRYGRVRATGLLRFPAFAPMLRGFEPHGRLLAGDRRAVVDGAGGAGV